MAVREAFRTTCVSGTGSSGTDSAFARGPRETTENLDQDGRSLELAVAC